MLHRRFRAMAGGIISATVALLLLAVPLGTDVATASLPTPPIPPLPGPPLSDNEFYTPPSPLPDGEPGDVIKTRDLPLSIYPNARAQQIMYLSTDDQGDRIPVTGLLLVPLNQKLGDDNPLIVSTPGTRGLADKCAPSRQAAPQQLNPASPDPSIHEIQQFLLQGITVVITDFAGQGTPGLHPYLVRQSEGSATLDALRAAQRVDDSGVSHASPVGISGYSQGGHGAASAAELQPEYAPELDLRGVLAGGVPTDMLSEVNHLNGNPTAGAGFGLAALIGLDAAHPELDLASRLTPDGEQVMERVKNSCYAELIVGFGTTSSGDVTQPDVLADPAWQQGFADSLLGTTAPGAPAYVYHGTIDTIVPFSQGSRLYHDWCARGASVEFVALPGIDHVTGLVAGPQRGVQWLIDRLNGADLPDGCREVAPL